MDRDIMLQMKFFISSISDSMKAAEDFFKLYVLIL